LIFDKYDRDSDGRISLAELKQMILSESYTKDIPPHTVRQILKRADHNANGYIEYPEFLNMVCTDFFGTISQFSIYQAPILHYVKPYKK
jgi:Ca2+-binding EF-hand superfamily protein